MITQFTVVADLDPLVCDARIWSAGGSRMSDDLAQAVRQSTQIAPALWRTTNWSGEEFKVGRAFMMPAASWSADRSVVMGMAKDHYGPPSSQLYVLELAPGCPGLDISEMVYPEFAWQKEWLLNTTLRTTAIDDSDPDITFVSLEKA